MSWYGHNIVGCNTADSGLMKNAVAVNNENVFLCPKCRHELEYFKGVGTMPEYLYCPDCVDQCYDVDGAWTAKLE